MKAMMLREHGPLENLNLEEVPDPVLPEGYVTIDVKACGVNFADSLMVKGTYQVKPDLPFSPGLEVSGYISEIGENVTGWNIGDKVQALTNWGGFAEKVKVKASTLVPLSDKIPHVDAASFVVAYGTSHVALTHRAKLQPGEWLVVHGAGGGVGLTAVEIGKLLGAKVIATAGYDDKLEIARSKGADFTINYKTEDVRTRIKEITDGQGANVVYDPVGGDLFTASLRSMAPEGRIVVIGFASGDVPQIPANHLLVKNVDVLGFYWGAYKIFKNHILTDSMTELLKWYNEGKIKPHVSQTFPLEQTIDAIKALKDRKSTGKVVVTI